MISFLRGLEDISLYLGVTMNKNDHLVMFEEGRMMEKDAKDNAGDEKIVVRIQKKQEAAPTPLFSPSDVRRFVAEFVSSWIRGDIIVRFPTAAEVGEKSP